jgi:feruloyl-CoA synthase
VTGLPVPLIADAVICGHDREYLAALAWPDLGDNRTRIAPCRRRRPEAEDRVVDGIGERVEVALLFERQSQILAHLATRCAFEPK